MRYLADHHISHRFVSLLKSQSFDIYRASDVLPVKAADLQILELARSENRTVISQDLDYSALLASKGYNRPSVVSLRLHNNRPERITTILEKILPSVEADLQTGVIVVIEESRIRIRPLPLP